MICKECKGVALPSEQSHYLPTSRFTHRMVMQSLYLMQVLPLPKDMHVCMSGLRQGVPQERQRIPHAPTHPLGMGGRIQCAAHKPPSERVVTHSVVVRQIKQARQVNSYIVQISCQDWPKMGLLGASEACKNWQELP